MGRSPDSVYRFWILTKRKPFVFIDSKLNFQNGLIFFLQKKNLKFFFPGFLGINLVGRSSRIFGSLPMYETLAESLEYTVSLIIRTVENLEKKPYFERWSLELCLALPSLLFSAREFSSLLIIPDSSFR